jgi:RNase adaptor protein for sRNA GlmZ degradation
MQSVPLVIDNLRRLVREDFHGYPYLCAILRELCALPRFSGELPEARLKVEVVSFSYRKGIPGDPSNNGGGFVFDCRGINNPGTYEHYNRYSGLDKPVVRFLEEDGEVTRFLTPIYRLVDATVDRYQEKGYTLLTVCFGCTGGRHRSVYSAQRLAEHLHGKFGMEVHLTHREERLEQTFPAWV